MRPSDQYDGNTFWEKTIRENVRCGRPATQVCSEQQPDVGQEIPLEGYDRKQILHRLSWLPEPAHEHTILYTYDVIWVPHSDVAWASCRTGI